MQKQLLAAGLIVATLAWAGGCRRGEAPSPDVWAQVNGTDIPRSEVEQYYRTSVNPGGQLPSHEEALSLMLNILDELINNQILLQRAQKLGLTASDGEVEDKFTEFKSPYTEDEFQRQLKDRGVTVDDLKKDIRQELSIQKLINREVVSKISITDQDVSDFYNQNRQQFNVAETQYHLAQIVVTPTKDPEVRNRKNDDATTDVEARRKSAALLAQLKNGADFAELAMDYSEDPQTAASGGDLGYVAESSLQKNLVLKDAVMALKPGEFSGIITVPLPGGKPGQLPDSYRILKLIAKEAPGQRDLNDPTVQSTIRDALRTRKEQLLRTAYLTEARNEAKVSNYLAQQVIESAGRLPDISSISTPPPPSPSQYIPPPTQ
ncbi:MAG: SurA N-terminal domain-containing protein [Candidatus Acidiferrales bacterium]|jgi:peptidyl-prolyl cis-trans isomerase SurA